MTLRLRRMQRLKLLLRLRLRLRMMMAAWWRGVVGVVVAPWGSLCLC